MFPHLTKDQRFWLGWMSTTGVVWFLCLLPLIATGMATVDAGETLSLLPPNPLDFVLFYATISGLLGLVQSWLVRHYIAPSIPWTLGWVAACTLSWTGFWLLNYMSLSTRNL